MKLIAFLAVLAPSVPAQFISLQFTEVLVDPVGANAGKQVIEYQNTGNVDIDTTGWFLVAGATSAPLPQVKIPYGTIGRIHLGRQGVDTAADLYLPGFRTLAAADSLAFFKSRTFTDPKAIVDFVSWGGGTGNITVAVQGGQWKSPFESVDLPAQEGATIAHYLSDSWGRGNEAADWYQDTTPTLGRANDPASMFAHLQGCPNIFTRPSMGLADEKGRPWLGEQWEVDLYNLPQSAGTALVALSTRTITPLPLDFAGMPGCNLIIPVDAVIGVARNLGVGKLTARVPSDPRLIGFVFYTQALVPDPSYPNPARAMVTNALVFKLGSR